MNNYTNRRDLINLSESIVRNINNMNAEEAKKAAEKRALNEAEEARMNNFLYRSVVAPINKEREYKEKMSRLYNYNENASVIGMTEAVYRLVEASLLLDKDMYKSLREDYDVFVKSTIKDFLTKSELNESAITNEHTKNIMEFVTSITPDRETGINLTESEMYDEFGNKTWDAVENDIQSLSTDIMDNVARVIDNSASACQDIDDNLNAIKMQESTGLIRNAGNNTTNILEALALNEAKEMVESGKTYNKDLALANAVAYLTILEALNTTGLVSIGADGYKKIINLSNANRPALNNTRIVSTPSELQEAKQQVRNFKTFLCEGSTTQSSNIKSWAEWKKAKDNKDGTTLLESSTRVIKENNCRYVNLKGEGKTTDAMREYVLSEGYTELDIKSFGLDSLASILGFRKKF